MREATKPNHATSIQKSLGQQADGLHTLVAYLQSTGFVLNFPIQISTNAIEFTRGVPIPIPNVLLMF